ncbi:MAG: hypothetical protein ACRCVP_09730 [Shewanella xiamenensis]
MKNSFNFIKEISLEIGISPVIKDGSILISDNLLSVVSRGDEYVLVSFPLPDGESFSAVSVVSDELKTLIINAYNERRQWFINDQERIRQEQVELLMDLETKMEIYEQTQLEKQS